MRNKKWDWHKNVQLEKSLHFSSHKADILPKLLTHELFILEEYQLNWKNIVNVLQVNTVDSVLFFIAHTLGISYILGYSLETKIG